ncbi:unnamed protein product [Ectocarpus sp. 4 AP-2014]|nr:unnamed protein product [Ectocarpus sp. CCAP 1310/34]
MFEAPVTVDGRGHLLGRLASVVAKELLGGQKVVVVRCEQITISGSLVRNKVKYMQYKKKRHNTNPKRGPYHFRSPARIFWRTVRGMLPRKTARGEEALARLSCFEGIPAPYDKKKRMVVPNALQVIRMAPGRRFCVLGRLSEEVGWPHADLIKRLEAQRKIKSEAYYVDKKAAKQLKDKATAEANLAAVAPVLEEYGF